MSSGYLAISWNRQKKLYDRVLAACVVGYLGLFVGLNLALHATATIETTLIRAFGTAAFLLLQVVLAIGPLCRLDARFLPLLYNRRHLGVTTFLLALARRPATFQFHTWRRQPLVTCCRATSGSRAWRFPFQQLGLAALGILFLAATSHDFCHNPVAPRWKTPHMSVHPPRLAGARVALRAVQTSVIRLASVLGAAPATSRPAPCRRRT